jgi:hypothetical protein
VASTPGNSVEREIVHVSVRNKLTIQERSAP